MLYINERKPLFQQHPLTDFLFLYTMLKQENNLAVVNNSSPSTYCFDVEAVNQFFAEDISVQAFTRYMRILIYENTRLIMRHCDIASGELPQEVLTAFEYLNGFSEVLDPYFTN
jgi:hypothetical protein